MLEPAPIASTSKGKGKAKATTSKAQPSNTPAPTPTPPPTLTIKQRQVVALTAESSHNFRDDNLCEFYESLQTITSSSDEVATDIRARLAAYISTLRGR